MTSIRRAAGALLIALTAGACTETQFPEATGEGEIRGINGIVDAPDMTFLIEERELGDALQFAASIDTRRFDDLEYRFNFDVRILGETAARRIASRSADIVKDTRYTFVLAGRFADPSVLVWEEPIREWTEGDSVYEISFGHAASSLGSVDVYYLPAGTAPVAGNAVGTVAFGERTATIEVAAGDYELVLTPPGDPSTIVFASTTQTLGAGATYQAAVFDPDPTSTPPATVRIYAPDGIAIGVFDRRFAPTVQFVHALFGVAAVDVARDGDFVNLLAASLDYGEVSADADSATGFSEYSVAPAGNTTPLVTEEVNISNGSRTMMYIRGEPSAPDLVPVNSIRRGYATSARVRAANMSTNFGSVDILFRELGNPDAVTIAIASSLPTGLTTGFLQTRARSYEVSVRDAGDENDTIVGGPEQIDLANGDVVEIAVLDTADPNVVELLIFSNQP